MDEANIKNFQELIDNYETFIKEIINELDLFKHEQEHNKTKINSLLTENKQLSTKISELLAIRTNSEIKFQYEESNFVENLKQQLNTVIKEKESAMKLWQNSAKTVDHLENELKLYQTSEIGIVSKNELSRKILLYEKKLRSLEKILSETQNKLETTCHELEMKNEEIKKTQQSHLNSVKIIKNLEDEILNLQKRLEETIQIKYNLEKLIQEKDEELKKIKILNAECGKKVEEAVQVVEAALNEKDAALLREKETKEEINKLMKTLSELIDETNEKVNREISMAKNDFNTKLQKCNSDLKLAKEEIKMKSLETESYMKERDILKSEIDRMQKGYLHVDESSTSKLLLLEKNLENTFQKLLLSEKRNIQLNSEKESIKNDLDQMASYYERDVNARETEKLVLKSKLKKIETELKERCSKIIENAQQIDCLNKKMESMEIEFQEQFDNNTKQFEEECNEKIWEMQKEKNDLIEELQDQMELQMEINKKWKLETRDIVSKFEIRINELKRAMNKVNLQNILLSDKLKEANDKIQEYKKILQSISQNFIK